MFGAASGCGELGPARRQAWGETRGVPSSSTRLSTWMEEPHEVCVIPSECQTTCTLPARAALAVGPGHPQAPFSCSHSSTLQCKAPSGWIYRGFTGFRGVSSLQLIFLPGLLFYPVLEAKQSPCTRSSRAASTQATALQPLTTSTSVTQILLTPCMGTDKGVSTLCTSEALCFPAKGCGSG